MDVLVRVALQGGHHWEFSCDEGDPMVTGLVSALPGAAVDPSLPADGLIQVESRTGERMFFTRTSLVSVTIVRPVTHATSVLSAQAGGGWPGARFPSPFALIPHCLDDATVAALQTTVAASPVSTPQAICEVDLDRLPLNAADQLVAVVAEAGKMLGVRSADDTHLDIKLYQCHSGEAPEFASPVSERTILHFVVLWPAQEPNRISGSIQLYDRLIETSEPSGRTVDLQPNVALLFPAGTRHGALQLEAGAPALVLIGTLRTSGSNG